MKTETQFLLEHNLTAVPPSITRALAPRNMVGTVFRNIMFYGYIPSDRLYKALTSCDKQTLISFWDELKPALEAITGADKRMGDHIVYKNFPQEVLDMTEGKYWVRQILMYWGLPNELFTQDEAPRDSLLEETEFKVLRVASNDSLQTLYDQLLGLPAKWTKGQASYVVKLLANGNVSLDLAKIPFKENLVNAAVEAVKRNLAIQTRSATDVLRLGVALSGGDFSLKENSRFVSFSRPTRRFLLGLLENSSNLQEDMARDVGRWKRFMRALRPGDYAKQFHKVVSVYNALYRDNVQSFNAKVERLLARCDTDALILLEKRPGEFARRLQVLVQLFGRRAVKHFEKVAPKLKVVQLLKLRRYFATVPNRTKRTFAPRGNWTKLQIHDNQIVVKPLLFKSVVRIIDSAVKNKISARVPSVHLDPRVENITIQGNDSELTNYGRNTKFAIPDNVTFIRTASYWKFPTGGFSNIWYDNGLNFFDKNWKSLGTCCWNSSPHGNGYSVFSGDPTNSKTASGEACQMIDLYLDKAVQAGVRFVVWNILCYSGKNFDEAQAVHAALQWGEKPRRGKTFEPSRCQLSFPVTGKNMTKYIAVIDVVERQVIYIDANLKGTVHSAANNAVNLSQVMPAYMEYLETQPTILDLFKDIPKSKTGIPVLYDDKDVDIKNDKAYVFKPLNENNEFTQIDLTELLTL